MDGKFTIWFLVTLCAVVGCQGRSSEPQLRGIIDDIHEQIKNVVNEIFDALNDLPSIIEKLDQKIDELIKKVDFSGILIKIKAKITEIINDAGLGVDPIECIIAEESEVNNMLNAAKNTVDSCKDEAVKHSQDLVGEMNKLGNDTIDLVVFTKKEVRDCMAQSWNPIKVIECLYAHLADIKGKAKILIRQIETTVSSAQKTSGDVAVTLVKCVASVNKELFNNQKEIIMNFKKCVDDIQAQS